MVITDLVKKSARRYRIDVDGEYFYIVDIEIVADFSLFRGKEVDDAFLDEVKSAAEYRKGKERALYLLGIRDHSKKELVMKLRKSVSYETACQVADKMEDLGLLNEKRYAEKMARHLILSKKHSSRLAERELIQKGIDPETAREAVDAVPENEADVIAALRKKYPRLIEEREKKRALSALARLGYGYYECVSLIEQAQQQEQGDDEE